MASNRLFIFDPESNSAVCIGRGYSNSWSSRLRPYIDEWLDKIPPEFTGSIKQTRLELKTEFDLPKNAKITWEPSAPLSAWSRWWRNSTNPLNRLTSFLK